MTTILVLAGILAVPVVVAALLVWGVLLILGRRKTLWRVFKRAGITYAVLLPFFIWGLTPLVFAYLLSHAGTRPPDLRLEETPQELGCNYEDVTFSSRDGIDLSGWYLPGEKEQAAFSISHGLFRNRHEVMRRACDLNQKGYPVLLFDFRAHGSLQGRSGEGAVSLGYRERQDVQGAVDFLLERGHKELVLMGVSMGAVAVIEGAPAVSQHLKGLVVDSPFQSLDETVGRHVRLILGIPGFPFGNIFAFGLRWMTETPSGEPDTTKALAQLDKIPVLLIYGGQDQRMPEETAQAVFEAVPGERKQLVYFPEAGHGNAYDNDPRRYVALVESFVQDLDPSPRPNPSAGSSRAQ
ncbi:MAG TPA: alpha/beta fold hydrolase [Acidobacteriota bacterium]|nr:alpha/beta fold hydrolase [Acidobacteriota bacterium]